MSKFCENCGAEMDDNQVVCPNCGNGAEAEKATVVEETVEEVKETTTSKTSTAKSDNIKKIGIIAGIAVVAVAIIVFIVSLISGGYKNPIKNMVKGMNKADADIYLKAYPDFLKMDKTIDDDYLKEQKKDDEKTYGDNVKYTVKFLKKEKIEKKDLEYVVDYVKEKYDEKVKISKGFKVKVEQRTKGKEDYDYGTTDMYVYKIDGKWYRLSVSPESAKKSLNK